MKFKKFKEVKEFMKLRIKEFEKNSRILNRTVNFSWGDSRKECVTFFDRISSKFRTDSITLENS